ncbi:hypothetical protein CEB3_c12250 [Peptococcaceae bacterium CEB3]|nr:hypothetical protein CEB3_c12250 [Peptococcaceae bacterium CEB3]
MIWPILATIVTIGVLFFILASALVSATPLHGAPTLGTAINLGQWAKPERVDLSAAIIGLIALAFVLRFFGRWLRLSGLALERDYLRTLGGRRILRDIVRALLGDSLALASVLKRSKKRWLVHSLVLYGFLLMTLSTSLAALLNYADAPHGFWWPPRIAGNLGGLSTLIGLSIMAWRLWRDPYENNGKTYRADLAFVILLYLTTLMGFATEYTMYGLNVPLAHDVFLLHMLLVSLLFLTFPFTRFSHSLLTPFLLIITRLNRSLVNSRNIPAFAEEPAPGRHHKTERLAADLQKQLDPQRTSHAGIRYFP